MNYHVPVVDKDPEPALQISSQDERRRVERQQRKVYRQLARFLCLAIIQEGIMLEQHVFRYIGKGKAEVYRRERKSSVLKDAGAKENGKNVADQSPNSSNDD